MNKAARKAVNLSVLQRHDPHISDILDSSSHVVVYKFDEDSQAWTKKGVEGTMFVFKRTTLPSYGFFIMNRLGLDNFMADLTGDMALQLTSDYIIYRDEKDIHGIWIYEPTDRDRIGEKLLECCQKAKEETSVPTKPQMATSTSSTSFNVQSSAASPPPEPTSADPLTRMLSDAMSRARVSETSGAPLASPDQHTARSSVNSTPAAYTQQTSQEQQVPASAQASKSEIPSFLLAIISQQKEKSPEPLDGSPLPRNMDLTQSMLLDSLTGSGKPPTNADRKDSLRNGPPLSAEFLPASVMPSGLYSNSARQNGSISGQGGQHVNQNTSPSSTMMAATLLNRPGGQPPQGSPLQAPAFAYSPGMMPSPLAMPMMRGLPLMHPPPPPPLPFQQHPMGPSMGIPLPPPPPQPPMPGPSFPADAMHAAMGAVGFMQQQQRGFMGQGPEVLSKAEFSQQFLSLLQSDPQFMDV
ncbi:hypothetical protein BGZ99_001760, partial [Dissophora globulifera]